MPEVNYLWDPIEDNVIAELDEGGGIVAEYTTEPEQYGNVVSQRHDGETNCFYSDGLGSTTEVTNEGGDVIATRANNAFGESTESSGDLVFPFQFVGQKGYYCDSESLNYYIRRRDYWPIAGRWLAIDPLQFIDGINHYAYVQNIPTIGIDPTGNRCCVCKWERYGTPGTPASFIDANFLAGQTPAKTGIDTWWYLHVTPKLTTTGFPGLPAAPAEPTTVGVFSRTNTSAFTLGAQTFPIGSYRLDAALFFITADVREDNPGDCVVKGRELIEDRVLDVKTGILGKVNLTVKNIGPKIPTIAGGTRIGNFMIGDLEVPGANPIVPTKPGNSFCTKRIVITDMPQFVQILPPILGTLPGFGWQKRQVKQELVIYDQQSEYTITQQFTLTNIFAPHSLSFTFKPGGSNVGNCNVCESAFNLTASNSR